MGYAHQFTSRSCSSDFIDDVEVEQIAKRTVFGVSTLPFALLVLTLALFVLPPLSASASTITLSDVSSDLTPASDLDATLDFVVLGGDTLQLTTTNLTSAPNEFNINEIYWNATSVVSGLTLLSATHSVAGDVFAGWAPVVTGQSADGFGAFDFALIDGVGEGNPNVIGSGESIVFLLSISGSCASAFNCSMTDFIETQSQGYIGAAKFTNGPDDPEAPGMEDSAFGAAVIPEPGSALLIGLGLLGLARRR